MGNYKRKYRRFLLRNRDKGIPKLMLWICIANAIVFVIDYLFQKPIVDLLVFDSAYIMQGQVWRLFSYIFTFAASAGSLFGPIIGAIISILFYYWIGNILEEAFGTLRFNFFYLAGIVLMDLYLLLVYWIFDIPFTADANYLNLSMFLAAATLMPDQKVYIYFIIPVKLKWLAWLDLGLCLLGTVSMLVNNIPMFRFYNAVTQDYIALVLLSLYPWVSILNYFLFFGKDVRYLFPSLRDTYRRNKRRHEFQKAHQQEPNPDWAKNYRAPSEKPAYRHRCTVCGRTDTENPGLEFRYCSRCKGYYCYCIEHINNHTHVE